MAVGIQTKIMRAEGFARLRGGVTNSLVAGTCRVMESDRPEMSSFQATFTAGTIVDGVSGFNVLDVDVPITRRFVLFRFVGDADFVPGAGDTFEFDAVVAPQALS